MANPTDPRPTISTVVRPASRPTIYGPMRAGGGIRPLLGRSAGQISLPGPTTPGLSRFNATLYDIPEDISPVYGYAPPVTVLDVTQVAAALEQLMRSGGMIGRQYV